VKIYRYNGFVVFYLHFGKEMVLKRDAAISIVSTINMVFCDQCLFDICLNVSSIFNKSR